MLAAVLEAHMGEIITPIAGLVKRVDRSPR